MSSRKLEQLTRVAMAREVREFIATIKYLEFSTQACTHQTAFEQHSPSAAQLMPTA